MRAVPLRGSLEAIQLDQGSLETDVESFDLAEPAVSAGLGDALAEVLDDLQKASADTVNVT